jgi:hypothetical protein
VQKIQGVFGNEFSGNFVIKYQTSLLVFSFQLYFIKFSCFILNRFEAWNFSN